MYSWNLHLDPDPRKDYITCAIKKGSFARFINSCGGEGNYIYLYTFDPALIIYTQWLIIYKYHIDGYDFLNMNAIALVTALDKEIKIFLIAIKPIKQEDHIFYSYGDATDKTSYLCIQDMITKVEWKQVKASSSISGSKWKLHQASTIFVSDWNIKSCIPFIYLFIILGGCIYHWDVIVCLYMSLRCHWVLVYIIDKYINIFTYHLYMYIYSSMLYTKNFWCFEGLYIYIYYTFDHALILYTQ